MLLYSTQNRKEEKATNNKTENNKTGDARVFGRKAARFALASVLAMALAMSAPLEGMAATAKASTVNGTAKTATVTKGATAKKSAATAKAAKSKKNKKTDKAKKITLTRAQKRDYSSKKQGSLTTNAKKIYSILSAAGIPKVNIAGVLGNWEVESTIDPTSIEGIYSESYRIGSKKTRALNSPASQAYRCFSMYAASGLGINRSAYRRANGCVWPGIGLGGFTGRSIDPLMRFAKRNNIKWYSLECQVAYAIKAFPRAKWLASWKKPAVNTYDAAAKFLRNWEGCSLCCGKRAAKASKWLSKMRHWKADLEYGRAVLSMK